MEADYGSAAKLSQAGQCVFEPVYCAESIQLVDYEPEALIAFATLFPVYLNLYNGIRGVDKRLVDAALSFGLNRWQLIVHVILPGALPSLLVGLRYALTVAIVMLVIAEQINASAGLGFLVNNARDFMRTDIIVVCLMVYALLGLSVDFLIRIIENRALAWRPKLVEA